MDYNYCNMANSMEELKKSLIEQHDTLQLGMEEISNLIKSKNELDAKKTYSLLIKFNDNLNKHLELENHQFYPELIKQMRGVVNTEKMKTFFHDMPIMEKAVYRLLKKYSSAEKIKELSQEFKKEFEEIKDVLSLRMDLEETKVF